VITAVLGGSETETVILVGKSKCLHNKYRFNNVQWNMNFVYAGVVIVALKIALNILCIRKWMCVSDINKLRAIIHITGQCC